MATLDGNVGPKAPGTGAVTGARFDLNGSLATVQAHGVYAEPSRRGAIFVASTPLAGTTAAAAHLSPVAAAAATLLSLHNPIGSGVELSILKVTGDFISGTVEVGTYCWNFHGASSVSAVQSAALTRCARVNGTSSGAGKAKAFTGEAITGGLLGLQGPNIGMWATAGTQRFEVPVDGLITVPEGCMVTIGAPTNATSTVSAWSIWYEELAIV